jgi:hypothetical protein
VLTVEISLHFLRSDKRLQFLFEQINTFFEQTPEYLHSTKRSAFFIRTKSKFSPFEQTSHFLCSDKLFRRPSKVNNVTKSEFFRLAFVLVIVFEISNDKNVGQLMHRESLVSCHCRWVHKTYFFFTCVCYIGNRGRFFKK